MKKHDCKNALAVGCLGKRNFVEKKMRSIVGRDLISHHCPFMIPLGAQKGELRCHIAPELYLKEPKIGNKWTLTQRLTQSPCDAPPIALYARCLRGGYSFGRDISGRVGLFRPSFFFAPKRDLADQLKPQRPAETTARPV